MNAAHPIAALVLALALPACSAPPSGEGRARASAATIAACSKRADDVYLRQNRDEIYRADNYIGNTRDSPFSSTGLSGITSAGLSGRYARDNIQEACLNSSSGPGGDASDPKAALAPTDRPASAPAATPARRAPATR